MPQAVEKSQPWTDPLECQKQDMRKQRMHASCGKTPADLQAGGVAKCHWSHRYIHVKSRWLSHFGNGGLYLVVEYLLRAKDLTFCNLTRRWRKVTLAIWRRSLEPWKVAGKSLLYWKDARKAAGGQHSGWKNMRNLETTTTSITSITINTKICNIGLISNLL